MCATLEPPVTGTPGIEAPETDLRLIEVVRRTDLWSDQIVTLRTIQTLTMLDVHHYCQMVWRLGRYDQFGVTPAASLPLAAELQPHR